MMFKCDQSFTYTECELRFLHLSCTSYTKNFSQPYFVEMSSQDVTFSQQASNYHVLHCTQGKQPSLSSEAKAQDKYECLISTQN